MAGRDRKISDTYRKGYSRLVGEKLKTAAAALAPWMISEACIVPSVF